MTENCTSDGRFRRREPPCFGRGSAALPFKRQAGCQPRTLTEEWVVSEVATLAPIPSECTGEASGAGNR